MQSLRRAVGKSIKTCYCLRELRSIKTSRSYEFQQQGRRFRSTSSFLLNNSNSYPKIGLHSIYGRSFSSRPSGDDIIISGGVVDEASKVPFVEQLFDSLPDLAVAFPVGCTLVGMIILLPRLLKNWPVKRPNSDYYQDWKCKCFCLNMLVAWLSIIAQDSVLNQFIIIIVATCTQTAIHMLLNEVEKLQSRLSLPFSVGDTIKIWKKTGYMEVKVLEIGRTTTTLLLTAEKRQLYVPNSNILRQIIVRSIVKIIQLKIDDVDKITRISEDITSMLKFNPSVCLEMEVPYCSCVQCVQERSYLELTLKYDLIAEDKMSDEDIFLNVVRIVKEHGGELISNPTGSYLSLLFGSRNRNYTYF